MNQLIKQNLTVYENWSRAKFNMASKLVNYDQTSSHEDQYEHKIKRSNVFNIRIEIPIPPWHNAMQR